MHVFVDANMYLSLLYIKDGKTNSLENLKKAIEGDEIKLLFPLITQHEFLRNYSEVAAQHIRENYIEKKKKLKQLRPSSPAIVRKENAGSALTKKFDSLIKAIGVEEKKYRVAVKKLAREVESITKIAEDIHESDEVIKRAKLRRQKGNPPGKIRDPLGDEIAWELFLSECGNDDLVIVTSDSDWKNALLSIGNEPKLNPLIIQEWKKVSRKKISVYSSIADFVNAVSDKEVVTEEDVHIERSAASLASLHNLETAAQGARSFAKFYDSIQQSGVEGLGAVVAESMKSSAAAFAPFLEASHTLSTLGAHASKGIGIGICEKCGQRLPVDRLDDVCLNCEKDKKSLGDDLAEGI